MPDRLRTTRRLAGRVGIIALVLALAAAGCTAADSTPAATTQHEGRLEPAEAEARYGPENYLAPIALLSFEAVDEVGDGIVYRQVNGLESLVARARLPLLLGIVDRGHPTIHGVQALLEQLAADWQGRALVVLADSQAEDPLLALAAGSVWPSFAVIRGAELVYRLEGFDGTTAQQLGQALAREVG